MRVIQYGGEMKDATRLAGYFLKQNKMDGGARMNFSRNCEKPVEEKKEIRRSNCYSEKIVIPAGYFVNKDLTFQGSTRDGYPCQHIVLERCKDTDHRYWDFNKGDYLEGVNCGKNTKSVDKAVDKTKGGRR